MRQVTIDIDVLKDMEIGLDAIAITSDPAIEVLGLHFKNNKKKGKFIREKRELFSSVSEQIIAGPIMMVKDIYRYSEDDGEYEIIFDAPAIKALYNQFMSKLPFLNKQIFNEEHTDKKIKAFIQNSILIETEDDVEYIKKKYKQELPLGTAFIVCKIEDKSTFDYLVENNKLGFSVEGLFKLDEIIKESLRRMTIYQKYKNKIRMKKSNFKKVHHLFKPKHRNKFTAMIDEIVVDGGVIEAGVAIEVIDESGEVIENWTGEVSVLDEASGEVVDIEVKNGEIESVSDESGEDVAIAEEDIELNDEKKEDEEEEKKEELNDEVASIDIAAIETLLKSYLDQMIELIAGKEAESTPVSEDVELSEEKKDEKEEAFKRALSRMIGNK